MTWIDWTIVALYVATAIGIGACYALSEGDWVIPSLRTMEAFWARGVTVLEQLNALIGNSLIT